MAVRKTTPGRDLIESQPLAPVAHPVMPVPPIDDIGVHPMMISSLPSQASGADVYARQFYRGNRVPFRRYLPLNGL